MIAWNSSLPLLGLVSIVIVPLLCLSESGTTRPETVAGLVPVPDEEPAAELALLMGDLQRLTHKLALSADAGNGELAGFYLHESREQLIKIQSEAPEYENLPVSVLIDRMAHPVYEAMQTTLASGSMDRKGLLAGVDAIVQSCNACHLATQHGFIRITLGTEVNPFNQSFAP